MGTSVAIDNGWTTSRPDSLDDMLKAVADRRSPWILPTARHTCVSAIYYQYVGEMEQSLAEHEKALSLNPNDADVLAITAWRT